MANFKAMTLNSNVWQLSLFLFEEIVAHACTIYELIIFYLYWWIHAIGKCIDVSSHWTEEQFNNCIKEWHFIHLICVMTCNVGAIVSVFTMRKRKSWNLSQKHDKTSLESTEYWKMFWQQMTPAMKASVWRKW